MEEFSAFGGELFKRHWGRQSQGAQGLIKIVFIYCSHKSV